MRSQFLRVLALYGCTLVAVPPAVRAEIAEGESIEWVVADSDRVVLGKVLKVEMALGKDKRAFEVATVAVTRTFKGAAARRVKFVLRNYNGPCVKGWLKDGVPMVFCLTSRARAEDSKDLPAGFDWILRDDGNDHSAVLLGKTARPRPCTIPVLTRDCRVLTDPNAIIGAVDAAARPLPKGRKRRAHTLDVPFGTEVFNKLSDGSAVELTVPVDEGLERLGRVWCRSDDYEKRIAGAKALRYFKNDRNIKVLKRLLKDPDFAVVSREGARPGQTDRRRVYEVRQLALEALQTFGVKVNRPVVQEVLEGPDKSKR